MSKYLYGAAVQGIQEFIFKTNKLRDVIGASNLVAQICTSLFSDLIGSSSFAGSSPKAEMIVSAAGNIKCLFHDKELCKMAVSTFPRKVMTAAPGITISQAVVEMHQENDFASAVEELERNLRIQRNIPAPSITIGLTGIERAQSTGLPAVAIDNEGKWIDEGTLKKRSAASNMDLALCKKSFGEHIKEKEIPYELKHLTDKNDWIAIIHADGNGLGKIVEKKGHNRAELHKFSTELDDATAKAAQATYYAVTQEYDIKGIKPLRPIILGGDDMTIICRADIAFLYASEFLKNFEKETEKKGMALTACAGIAFIKSKFPFYYGYQLAESLCEQAKKDARKQGGNSPSCLLFHKVQSAFFDNYETIVKQELTLPRNHSFEFGPYYINKGVVGRWDVGSLLTTVKELSRNNNVKNAIREWSSLMFDNPALADQRIARAISLIDDERQLRPDEKTSLIHIVNSIAKGVSRSGKVCHPAYDILTLLTITNQETRNNKQS